MHSLIPLTRKYKMPTPTFFFLIPFQIQTSNPQYFHDVQLTSIKMSPYIEIHYNRTYTVICCGGKGVVEWYLGNNEQSLREGLGDFINVCTPVHD